MSTVTSLRKPGAILLGGATKPPSLLLKYANRHGLIAGATGTGKTISLQVLAEGFSQAGVPVFMADVKGDLSGLAAPARPHAKITERVKRIGLPEHTPWVAPVMFWDIFGTQGSPIRTTVSEMGPVLMARMLDLNDTQEGVLNIAFRVADEQGWLLLDLKDLQAILRHCADHASQLSAAYGHVSGASVGAIQRKLLVLEQQRGEEFFGEPALDIRDFMRTTDGHGNINILAADELITTPKLYATFLLWLLSELFEELPEVGDQDKPQIVFFFDEAHLLFSAAPRALVEKVTQVVKLVRSKGVGVYFITQSPTDIPDAVLGQLGNRVQHALRAFTPRDQKAVKAAAQTFRANPDFDVATVIATLGVGEALVSVLDEDGSPSVVQQTLMCPPRTQIGPVPAATRGAANHAQAWASKYKEEVDRHSAYEILQQRAAEPRQGATSTSKQDAKRAGKGAGKQARRSDAQKMATSAMRSFGTQIGGSLGRSIMRGLLGSILK